MVIAGVVTQIGDTIKNVRVDKIVKLGFISRKILRFKFSRFDLQAVLENSIADSLA